MKLNLDKISFQYRKNIILTKTSYNFYNGKIYCLIGNNGVGKTTLFNIIAGILDYDGNITLDGVKLDIGKISYIRSTPNTPDFMTGEEYLKYFIKLHNIESDKTIGEHFKSIGLSLDDKDKLLNDYSHGMKNKLELLVNILADTEIILLDEPFVNLDLVAREEFKNILNTIKKDKIIILSTNSAELCLSLADEVVILHNKVLNPIPKNKEQIIEKMKESHV